MILLKNRYAKHTCICVCISLVIEMFHVDGNRIILLKEGLQSVLRIGSAHNKGGPPNINIVQISHFSNSF